MNNVILCILSQKKTQKQRPQAESSDPFGDNDDDVARIAREFERKYSNAYSGRGIGPSSLHNGNKGTGYDENDTFIDNSEAVSLIETVPIARIESNFS